MAPPTQRAPLPGEYYDVPGVGGGTQYTDQRESTVSLATVMSQTSQVPVNGVLNFKQTDVVMDWVWSLSIAQAFAAGGGALTNSPYAPWNMIGPVRLPIQNQYNSVDVESGIDLYIFNLLRPWRATGWRHVQYANPTGFPAGSTALGYEFAANAQANLIVPAQWTNALGVWQTLLRLPASITFDIYYDLAVTGEPMAPPHKAVVSPQFMAGSTRVITPLITMNPGFAATADLAPVTTAGGAPTFAGTLTSTFRRKAIYSADPALLPPVYAWQYRWRTTRFGLNGVSTKDIPVPQDTGQLLAVYVRMFDPAAGGGLGAPININVVSRISLQYGSGLFWLDAQTFGAGPNAAALVQREWLTKHNSMLPAGVLAFDLGLDERGQMTNARALNTLTTAGILVHIEFTGAQSVSAYAVLGTESLVYVS